MLKQILLLMLIASTIHVAAQTPDSVNRKKLIIASATVGTAYTASMIALGSAWYDDTPKQSFHFFDDAAEWKQMDKLGHMYSSFHIADNASLILRSCKLSRKKSDLIGAATSMLIVSSIEIFDGYSAAYGASATDLAANAAGTMLYLGQSWLWEDVRIYPKFSFHSTLFASQRPNVLGNGVSEIVKDYNGQTIWLSGSVKKFFPSSRWPAWLNIAAGYGAENMIYARDSENLAVGYQPYRQYYLSLDVDLTAIPTKSKLLKAVLKGLNVIKIPAPAIEFSDRGVRFHPLYF